MITVMKFYVNVTEDQKPCRCDARFLSCNLLLLVWYLMNKCGIIMNAVETCAG